MKNRNFCKLLASTVIVIMLSAGCGASNAAPAKEEAATEATEATVTEEETVTEETPEVEPVADTSETTKSEENGVSPTESQNIVTEERYIVNDSYSDVCFRLAECYHYGIGTEKDLQQALFFAGIVRDEAKARLDRGDMYGGYLYPRALKEWQDI